MRQKSFGDAASICLQILRSIGKHYEEDSYYASYDDYFTLTSDCSIAGECLMSLGNNQEVPQSLKDNILKSLDEICDLSAYTEYYIYEIAELRDEFEMNARPLSKVLERVEKELAGMDESDFGLFVPVSRKINLLYLLNRKEEAEATTLRYLFLPEIRNLWVDGLIDEEKYGEALSVLDEGICLERQKDQSSYVRNWVEKKLEIYQRMQDIPHVISTAKYLFLEKKGDLGYYRLLKQSVPAGEWKLFYNELIAQTPFPKSYWTSSVEADIYVEERDFVRLVDFLRRNSSLEILLNYSHCLKDDYPEDLLERFSSQVQAYADKSTGRPHYEYVAKALKEMLKLKGGEQEVRLLVDVFRQAYKRRRAMMEILNGF